MHQEDEVDTNDVSSFEEKSFFDEEHKSVWPKIISWALFSGGCIAVTISAFDYPIRDKATYFYDQIFVDQQGYTSIIKDQEKKDPADVQEILNSLSEDYSPNLLLKLNREELGNSRETQLNIQNEPAKTEIINPLDDIQNGNLISPPPIVEIVLSTTETSSQLEKSKDNIDVEVQKISDIKSEPVLKTFKVEEEIKAPLRPIKEPKSILQKELNPKAIASLPKKIKESSAKEQEPVTIPTPLKLEDFILGMTWESSKSDIQENIVRCIPVTESIEGCRLNFQSWLPNTRHVIGLFDEKENGNLIAIQIDSIPFNSNQEILDSFNGASRVISEKTSNFNAAFKEQLVTDSSNMILLLNSDTKQRHFRHWSLTSIQIPADIHSSIKLLDSSTAFYRTLFIKTKLEE
ncbi:hypothetical protein [Curvivirga aplysinae]|uniref:hypothetical protein n=1 Tax=Curvivirga aplysinae TaxID=2529852 RepID=UPI0012BD29E3|nr:hypothetical protein [Curvivirga aplysinae]MTI10437.1 hypothetical protein [Curvivirga aplysinae]